MFRLLSAVIPLAFLLPAANPSADDLSKTEIATVEVTNVDELQSLPPGTSSVLVDYKKADSFPELIRGIAKHPQIQHLTLRIPNSTRVKDEQLDVLRELQSLESLEVDDARDWPAPLILDRVATLKNLKQLKLIFCCRTPSDVACKEALRAMKNLETATISDRRSQTQVDWEVRLTQYASDLIAWRKGDLKQSPDVVASDATAPDRTVPDRTAPGIPTEPFLIGNRDEPTDSQLSAFSKIFCVALRKLNNDASKRGALRVFVDPRYLKQHGLLEGAFPIETLAVVNVYNIEIANDRRTAICQVSTREKPAELFILRLTLHDGSLYLKPAAPDPKTGTFTPWIYQMKRNVPVPPGAPL